MILIIIIAVLSLSVLGIGAPYFWNASNVLEDSYKKTSKHTLDS